MNNFILYPLVGLAIFVPVVLVLVGLFVLDSKYPKFFEYFFKIVLGVFALCLFYLALYLIGSDVMTPDVVSNSTVR